VQDWEFKTQDREQNLLLIYHTLNSLMKRLKELAQNHHQQFVEEGKWH
jgi:hypothetical protein